MKLSVFDRSVGVGKLNVALAWKPAGSDCWDLTLTDGEYQRLLTFHGDTLRHAERLQELSREH